MNHEYDHSSEMQDYLQRGDRSTLKRKGENNGKSKKSKQCKASKTKWTNEEDEILTKAVMVSGEGNWKKVAQSLNDRTHLQCLHRWQKVLNPALVKGPWKEEEDAKLSELVEKFGPKDWSTIASHIPGRIGKQCRERWFNHLSPEVRKTNWTPEEDRIIIDAHSKIGNKWTNISKLLDGRPANAIKNHWNSTLLKRIQESTGEPISRRDRTRTKKPAPMRATEFDFRTQISQIDGQASTDSPHQYSQHSPPASPPDLPGQDASTMLGAQTLRFPYTPNFQQHVEQQPSVQQHAFYTTYNNPPPPQVSNCSFTWDSWPTTNVIHLNPPAQPHVSTPHTINLTPNNISAHNFANFLHHGNNDHIQNNNSNNNNNNNAHMHGESHYEPDYNLTVGFSESPSQEEYMTYHPNQQHNNSHLSNEFQYCFDNQQSMGPPVNAIPLDSYAQYVSENNGGSVNSMGMNNLNGNNMNNVNMGMSLGLLNLDMPGLCPLDL